MNDRPKITPAENGPFRIDGGSAITRMRDGTALPLKERAFLCRCGGSSNKPFCDGTHNRNGFTSAKDPDRVPDKRESYTSSDGRITIHDNRGLCAHAGRCTDNLASVFRLRTEPFVDPDGAIAAEIAEVVDLCPSGALSYTLHDVHDGDRDAESWVGFEPGGPYILTGVDLVDVALPEGATEDRCTLCRCGASQNKPFCSGQHWYVDFDEDAGDASTR